jgi:hypothetical protein
MHFINLWELKLMIMDNGRASRQSTHHADESHQQNSDIFEFIFE